jgi:hypothetical protein
MVHLSKHAANVWTRLADYDGETKDEIALENSNKRLPLTIPVVKVLSRTVAY